MGVASFAFQPTPLAAQNRMSYSVVSPESGHIALGLAIRKLNVSGTFMQSAAHPDDEHNALYVLYTHGMGLRSIDLQTNRSHCVGAQSRHPEDVHEHEERLHPHLEDHRNGQQQDGPPDWHLSEILP